MALTKTQQRTAAVIAYEGPFVFMTWEQREPIAKAFAADFYRHSPRSFDYDAFIESCKRVSELGE